MHEYYCETILDAIDYMTNNKHHVQRKFTFDENEIMAKMAVGNNGLTVYLYFIEVRRPSNGIGTHFMKELVEVTGKNQMSLIVMNATESQGCVQICKNAGMKELNENHFIKCNICN
jgi:hypothetical protein